MTTATKVQRPGRMKAAILQWLGIPITLTDGAFWDAFYSRDGTAGVTVTVDKALQLSAVWACVRLISQTISTLPFNFYERQDDGSRREAKDHPLYEILHNQPNADMSAVQFWEAVVSSMLLRGAAFGEKQYLGKRLVAVDFLIPQRLQRRRLADGSIEYKYYELDGKLRPIPENRILNIPAFSLDGINGLTPVQYGVNVFSNAIAAEEVAGSTFANGMRFSGVFEFDHILKDGQRDLFKEKLDAYKGSINAGGTPLLEAGIKYRQITIDPSDAQLLETRGFSVEEICRWFGVPPFMVGHSEKSTSWGTGIEQQMIGFLTFCLRPWLARIEQAVRRSLLQPTERQRFFGEFAVEGLLRADSAARAAFYSVMTQNGIYTRDECRVLENRTPRGGQADVLTVQTNLAPIDLLGKEAAASPAGQAKAAILNWLMSDLVPPTPTPPKSGEQTP